MGLQARYSQTQTAARFFAVLDHLDRTSREPKETWDAFEARCLQHEIDHCQGLLFVDRVAGAHAIFARQTYL